MLTNNNRLTSVVVKEIGDLTTQSAAVFQRKPSHLFKITRSLSGRTARNSIQLSSVTLFAKFSTYQPKKVVKDAKVKNAQSARTLQSFRHWLDNIAKIPSSYYEGGPMSRVFNSLQVELPKNLPNIREYLNSLYDKNYNSDPLPKQKILKTSASRSNLKMTETPDAGRKSPRKGQELQTVPSSAEVDTFVSLQNPDGLKNVLEKLAVNKSLTDQMVSTASDAVNSTVNVVKHLSNYLPNVMSFPQKSSPGRAGADAKVQTPTSYVKTERTSTGVSMMIIMANPDWETIERRSRLLVYQLRSFLSEKIKVDMLQELNNYFVLYPKTQSLAVQEKIIPWLLKARHSTDNLTRGEAEKALALVGYVDSPTNWGIRVLTLDGGGTRGLITIEILKQLEMKTGKRIYELFDYVCGVSTGALVAIISCVYMVPLTTAEEIYMKFSKKMFARNKLVGVGMLFTNHSYYDTQLWEDLLMSKFKDASFVDTMTDPKCPKLSVVSTLTNVARVQNFLFRNYNLPAERRSWYLGSVEHKIWQAIRASSAAPGYFEELELGGYVHQDGGVLTNNPTAIALHECKLLWPNESIQCVVSIGTGKHEAKQESPDPTLKSSLKAKITKIVESATDTEAVHMVLHDLLHPSTYFRFNPPTSESFLLDEIRDEKWLQMQRDTDVYCSENQDQLKKAAHQLTLPKGKVKVIEEWAKMKFRNSINW